MGVITMLPISSFTQKETIDVIREPEHGLTELWKEYNSLVHALRKHIDPSLHLRLTVVMMDLGLYQPSPP